MVGSRWLWVTIGGFWFVVGFLGYLFGFCYGFGLWGVCGSPKVGFGLWWICCWVVVGFIMVVVVVVLLWWCFVVSFLGFAARFWFCYYGFG